MSTARLVAVSIMLTNVSAAGAPGPVPELPSLYFALMDTHHSAPEASRLMKHTYRLTPAQKCDLKAMMDFSSLETVLYVLSTLCHQNAALADHGQAELWTLAGERIRECADSREIYQVS